jgi:glycosyltransferase involved in cell wall biosynthesis
MILSIGIPTYNRAKMLENSLNNVASQITEDLLSKVSIIVADNSSTDNTSAVVNKIKQKYSDVEIIYHKHESNLGYDKNVNSLFSLSPAEYVMTLGDDDGIEDDAIKEIVKHLEEKKNVSVFYISNNFYDSDLIKKIKISDPFFENIGSNKFFKNGHELFKHSNEMFGGISGICIKRSSWNKIDSSKYFATNWIHLGVVLSIIKNAGTFVIFNSLIKYRMENKGCRWESLHTSLGIQRILLEFKEVFPDVVRGIYAEHRHQTRLSLLSGDRKQTMKARIATLNKMKLSYDTTSLSFWLVDFMLLFLPVFLTKTLFNTYKNIRSWL